MRCFRYIIAKCCVNILRETIVSSVCWTIISLTTQFAYCILGIAIWLYIAQSAFGFWENLYNS